MLNDVVETTTPDMIDPVVGWRTWNVARHYGKWMLESPDVAQLWAPGQAQHAFCKEREHETREQRERCNCGFNAFDSVEKLAESKYAKRAVAGEVEMWGEVTRYEDGWRSQWSRPRSLMLQADLSGESVQMAKDLSELYGIPVTIGRLDDYADSLQAPEPSNSAADGAAAAPAPARRNWPRPIRIAAAVTLWVIAAALPLVAAIAVAVQLGPDTAAQLAGGQSVGDHEDGEFLVFMTFVFLLISGFAVWMALAKRVLACRSAGQERIDVAACLSVVLVIAASIVYGVTTDTPADYEDRLNPLSAVPATSVSIPVDGKYAVGLSHLVHQLDLKVDECQQDTYHDLPIVVCRTKTQIEFKPMQAAAEQAAKS